MKKTLIAIAALSAAGIASAQVTLGGEVGFAVSDSGTGSSFGITDNSLWIDAQEDLGGGMKIAAHTQFYVGGVRGSAAEVSKEDTSLSLSTASGTLTLANTRTGDAAVSASGLSGASLPTDQWGIQSRVQADVVAYTLPTFNGLTATLQYLQRAADTSTASVANNKTTALVLNYANGPLSLGATMKRNSGDSEITQNEFNAGYDLGVAQVALGYTKAEGDDGATGLGVSVPVGKVTLGVGYLKKGNEKYFDAAAVYSLSKRTSINASFGKPNTDADSQYRVKLYHSF